MSLEYVLSRRRGDLWALNTASQDERTCEGEGRRRHRAHRRVQDGRFGFQSKAPNWGTRQPLVGVRLMQVASHQSTVPHHAAALLIGRSAEHPSSDTGIV
jgi:hypothetical protein